jgi:hypothetical protein
METLTMKTLLAVILVTAAIFSFGAVAKSGVQQWAAFKLAPVALAMHR